MTRPLSALVRGGMDVEVVLGSSGASLAVGQVAASAGRLFSDNAEADRVGVLMTNDRATVEVIVGAVVAGANLVSLPLPGRGADLVGYGDFMARVCQAQGLTEVVVADEYADLLESIGVTARRHSELPRQPLAAPSGEGFALVQFTSGSTGPPRPILVTDEQLGANVGAILEALQPEPGDGIVSWLPLSHDMGLIGMLLTGLAAGGPDWAGGGRIVLLDPATFLRDPASWLQAVDHWRGSFTAAPDFGYRLAVRRRPTGGVLDLSCLRCAIVGGEIVRAETLTAFATHYRSSGLKDRSLSPAYGMAEACLAVTMTRPDETWRSRTVAVAALADREVRPAVESHEGSATLVASGRPLRCYRVDTGSPGDAVGTVRISGPSLGVDGATGQRLAGEGDWYQTGDVGFVDDGWLYVCGRHDDYIVAHGRNLYAPALEMAVGHLAGVRPGRVAAIGLATGEWVLVAELDDSVSPTPRQLQRKRQEIRRVTVAAASVRPDEVVFAKPGGLPLTSSGKLQRNRIRASLAQGELPAL